MTTEIPVLTDRILQRLAGARVAELTKLVLPPSHEPVVDVMVSVWADGVAAGLQLAEQPDPPGLTATLTEAGYHDLASAGLCSQYEEFPELDDRDFQNLAFARVQKLSRMVQPASHPEVSGYTVEIWMDGVATALRIVKQAETAHQPAAVD